MAEAKGLISLAILVAALHSAPAFAQGAPSSVTVIRGGASQDLGEEGSGGVMILRGVGPAPKATTEAAASVPARRQEQVIVGPYGTWFYNPETRAVRACIPRANEYGEWRLTCTPR